VVRVKLGIEKRKTPIVGIYMCEMAIVMNGSPNKDHERTRWSGKSKEHSMGNTVSALWSI